MSISNHVLTDTKSRDFKIKKNDIPRRVSSKILPTLYKINIHVLL